MERVQQLPHPGGLTSLPEVSRYLQKLYEELQRDAGIRPEDFSRYYRKTEHVSTSAGAADAAKPIVLNVSGKVDSTMMPINGVPSGLIAIFDVACPTGWTRVTAFDSLFVRGAATYGGTGGADAHTHGIGSYAAAGEATHTHDVGTLAVANESAHTHQVDPPITTSSMSANTTVQSGSGAGVAAQDHTHTTDIAAFASAAGSAHAHGLSGATAAGASHAHALSGTSASGSTLPAYINVVFCKKD